MIAQASGLGIPEFDAIDGPGNPVIIAAQQAAEQLKEVREADIAYFSRQSSGATTS